MSKLRVRAVLCVLAIGWMTADGVSTDLFAANLDRRLFDTIHDDAKNPVLDATMPFTTRFGDPRYILVGTTAVVVLGKGETRRTGILVGASGFASLTVAEIGKRAIGRPRPLGPRERDSFPSGHTTAAFALATVLSHRYPRWRVVWYGMATGVGFSRVYLGRHYPGDVIAGAAVGTLVSRAVLRELDTRTRKDVNRR